MANVIAEVVKCYANELRVKFTTRVTNPVHMLELTEKFRTEQETEGPWEEFHDKLRLEYCQGYVLYEFFKGCSDVILELTVCISRNEDYKEYEVNSEQIAGTILQEVKDYLDLTYITLSQAYENHNVKDLLVFRGY